MMTNFSDITFEEFSELIHYLKEKDEKLFLERVEKFFPNASGEDFFELNFLCSLIFEDEEQGKSYFEKFKNEHPDLKFDDLGQSIPDKKSFDFVSLQSLDTIFEIAFKQLQKDNYNDSSRYKVNSQVYNGKKLSSLKNIEIPSNVSYNLEKVKFLKFNKTLNTILTESKLKTAEKQLSELNLTNNILLRLLLKISDKSPNTCKIFIDHFLQRLELLSRDKELKYNSNKEFYDSLKEIEI